MRCDEVQDCLDVQWEGQQPPDVRQHLTHCPACSGYYRDLRLVRAGLRLWQSDAAPEAPLGFAERLLRQLSAVSRAPNLADFFESVGRRFVYATFVLTLLTLLALTLPSTGPVRSLAATDIQVRVQEASLAYSDPIGETGMLESPEQSPTTLPTPDVSQEVK